MLYFIDVARDGRTKLGCQSVSNLDFLTLNEFPTLNIVIQKHIHNFLAFNIVIQTLINEFLTLLLILKRLYP